MERFGVKQDTAGQFRLECPYRGSVLLRHAMYSKGSAFTHEERATFGMEGLLPSHVTTLELQARRAYRAIQRKPDPLEKYIGLASLQDRNEVLFYRVLLDHLDELMPMVYTPTVGRVCQEFSHIFRRARGLWITPEHRGRIYDVLGGAPFDDVRLIVVTDNERILGLGDQGAGGMGIPIGKLALYTTAAGIAPWQTLPLSLDVGHRQPGLLDDELYLGYRAPRLRGPEYASLVEELVHAIRRRFPRALLQWEDFKKNNAFRLLDRYRAELPSFNDDIQGTAAVAAAGIVAATRVTEIPLLEQRVVLMGAGAAGIGIARLIRSTLQRAGLSGEALTLATASLDSKGLLVDDEPIADEHKRAFAWPAALAARYGLGAGQPRGSARGRARAETDGADRHDRRARRVHRGGGARDGEPRGAPAGAAAVEPDQQLRGDAGRRDRLDRRARAGRDRQPVRAGHAQRAAHRDRPGQQRLHLPGRRAGRDRRRGARGHRRDVRRRRRSTGSRGQPARPGERQHLPADQRHPARHRAHRRGGGARRDQRGRRAPPARRRADRPGGCGGDVGAGLPADGPGRAAAAVAEVVGASQP